MAKLIYKLFLCLIDIKISITQCLYNLFLIICSNEGVYIKTISYFCSVFENLHSYRINEMQI